MDHTRALGFSYQRLSNIYLQLWKALFQQQPEGPYADFTRANLLSWLRKWRGKDPGTNLRHSCSNLGYGLLGEAMASSTGKPFTELLAAKVIHPLGLRDTTGELSDAQHARFMRPRFQNGKPASLWTFDALAGAGRPTDFSPRPSPIFQGGDPSDQFTRSGTGSRHLAFSTTTFGFGATRENEADGSMLWLVVGEEVQFRAEDYPCK